MTISDATHALARSKAPRLAAPKAVTPGKAATAGEAIRLVDAMARVEPTWVEAVAVVQAVCAQLAPGQAAPALDAIEISPTGQVSFAPAGSSDDSTAVTAMGRLLSAILKTGDCPMSVWEATERARFAPTKIGPVASFGAALTCLAPAQGPHELQCYVESLRPRRRATARPAAESFAATGLTPRAAFVLLMVAMAGGGVGISAGALAAHGIVASRLASAVTVAAQLDHPR